MRFGSLFSGIGGLDLGLERAGFEVKWQCEIDPYATKVLEKHWPNVPRFRDVRECGAHNLPPVDLIAGGFPCQDVSLAGDRAGITGARSGLWTEYARIVRELRPRFVLVENVPGLLSAGMGEVLGDLAGLGYDAEWESLPASAFGAPHRRDRVFIVAYSATLLGIAIGGGKPNRILSEVLANTEIDGRQPWGPRDTTERTPGREFNRGGIGSELPDVAGQGPSDGPASRIFPSDTQGQGWMDAEFERRCRAWWSVESDVGRVAHGTSKRVDRLRCLGNSVVPQVAEWLGRRILETSTMG